MVLKEMLTFGLSSKLIVEYGNEGIVEVIPFFLATYFEVMYCKSLLEVIVFGLNLPSPLVFNFSVISMKFAMVVSLLKALYL